MAQISEIVDSLESKIEILLERYHKLQRDKRKLEETIVDLKAQNDKDRKEIQGWKEEFDTLKMANSILGSDQYKRDTKLKINALIREIDLCIAQLSE